MFVDANVFRSRTQMDWLFMLRMEFESAFQVHSTEDVLAEVAYSMRRQRTDLDGLVISRRLDLIRRNLDEVIEDFSGKIPFSGTDKDDLHVHAAATACRADLLLTNNRPDDITTTPESECYEIIPPDDFFILMADSFPAKVRQVARKQEEYWTGKGSTRTLAEALKRASCPNFARRVEYETTTRSPAL